MAEKTSPEYSQGFADGREFFVTCHDALEQARRYVWRCEVGESDYTRGWALAAQATIWEHFRALELATGESLDIRGFDAPVAIR